MTLYTVWAKQISHVCLHRCTLAKKLRQAAASRRDGDVRMQCLKRRFAGNAGIAGI